VHPLNAKVPLEAVSTVNGTNNKINAKNIMAKVINRYERILYK